MSHDLQLITAPLNWTEKYTIRGEGLQARDRALEKAALIGKVENAEQNNQCVEAKKTIKGLLSLFESERKKLKEPLLEAGRQLDRVVNTERLELEKEMGRLENLEKDFIRAEQRRVAEEQELQRQELARIEAQKQAELKRIADEQAAAERKAHEAALAAQKLIDEAKNKKQREAAEAAAAEARKLSLAAEETARQQTQLVTERADNAAYVESRPPEMTRARGQTVRKKWKIERIDSFVLVRARPDLVRKIEFDMVAVNQQLMEGVKLPGVIAVEDFSVSVRATNSLDIIPV